jgi:hypothetical protein
MTPYTSNLMVTSSRQNTAEFPSLAKEKNQGVKAPVTTVKMCVPFEYNESSFVLTPMKVILDPKTSKRIFELAKDQQDELEMPDDPESEDERMAELSRPRTQIMEDDEEDDRVVSDDDGEDVEEMFVSAVLVLNDYKLSSMLG